MNINMENINNSMRKLGFLLLFALFLLPSVNAEETLLYNQSTYTTGITFPVPYHQTCVFFRNSINQLQLSRVWLNRYIALTNVSHYSIVTWNDTTQELTSILLVEPIGNLNNSISPIITDLNKIYGICLNFSGGWYYGNQTIQNGLTNIYARYTSDDTRADIFVGQLFNNTINLPIFSLFGSSTNCFDITSSGYYSLSQNILADKEPCINISSSNVILDLNGYTIEDTPSSNIGIFSQSVSPSSRYANIIIKNGEITEFGTSGIYLSYLDNITLENISFTNNNYGNQILYGNNISIKDNNYYGNQYALKIEGSSSNYFIRDNFFNNVIKDLDVSTGSLSSSVILNNIFGNISVNPTYCVNRTIFIFPFGWFDTTTCVVPYITVYSGSTTNIDCFFCNFNDFVGNFYYGTVMDSNIKTSENNRFIRETYSRYPNSTNGLFLDSSTQNNWGCEIEGYVFDSGYNNTFVSNCPIGLYPNETTGLCSPTWKCIDNVTIAYQMPDCSFVSLQTCSNGLFCVDGKCISSVPTELSGNVLPTYLTPIIDFTFFGNSPIMNIMNLFFTPIFLGTTILLLISAYVSSFIGGNNKGIIFMTTAFIMVLLFTIFQIYPIWLAILVVVIAGFIIAKQVGIVGR